MFERECNDEGCFGRRGHIRTGTPEVHSAHGYNSRMALLYGLASNLDSCIMILQARLQHLLHIA
jgi:hypothetical protein